MASVSQHTKGFTLIEMIIALAIFSVVATVALGALVNIVSANKKAQSLQAAITNINYALETLSREMRVGSTYSCDTFLGSVGPTISASSQCLTLGSSNNYTLAFKSDHKLPNGTSDPCFAIIAYRFNFQGNSEWILEKAEQESCSDVLSGSDFVPIISPDEVTISDIGVKVSDDLFPLAFIRLSGFAGIRERERTEFTVQTAVSPRLIDQ
jgi:prepilin-type N-terminal cleavage/methylation domain-containing protein